MSQLSNHVQGNEPTVFASAASYSNLTLARLALSHFGDCLIPGSDGKSAARPRSLADLPYRLYNKTPHSALRDNQVLERAVMYPTHSQKLRPSNSLTDRPDLDALLPSLLISGLAVPLSSGEVITAERALLYVIYHCRSYSWISPYFKYDFSSSQSLSNRGWGKAVRTALYWNAFVEISDGTQIGSGNSPSNAAEAILDGGQHLEKGRPAIYFEFKKKFPPKRGQTYFLMAKENVKAEWARLSACFYVSILEGFQIRQSRH